MAWSLERVKKAKPEFVADRKRQRWIEAQGWRVIRFAAVEILNDPQACVNEVVEMFEGASNG